MVKPAAQPFSVELWREALGPLLEFRRAEPWRWTPDSAVSVYIDMLGQPWFTCILGVNAEVFGLCLYRGAEGLKLYRTVQELGAAFDPAEHQFGHDAVTVWYGPKGDLDPRQRDIWRKVGYVPKRGDRLAWPDVRSHRPGYFPWQPDEHELRALMTAVPGVLRFAELYRHHPTLYDDHGELDIPTVPAKENALTLDTLEWRTWATPPPAKIEPPVPVDRNDPAFERAASLPVANETIEVDWFHMPDPVSEGDRPFYPRCIAALRSNGGYCFGMELLKPDDDCVPRAAALILKAIERLGARPIRIVATKAELAIRLQPLAASLGMEARQVRRLGAAEEFRADLKAHFRAGGRARS
jgi:hypothetical protein